ncbi:TraR/DksA C4-type zinc finger protein [Sphaerisporangium sp. NPDC049002]|uniref:TraR/DksA family transcriptional regulator n=1 Tax=unclassified Sphaerisporangium TaxID=2630420 RepID=UPI0033FDB304
MKADEERTRLSRLQVRVLREEMETQLVWRTTQLSDLKGSIENGDVQDISRQEVLADIAATGRVIAEIRRSLDKVDDGTYGRCAGCGSGIPFDRLKIRPLSRYCMACQLRHESR